MPAARTTAWVGEAIKDAREQRGWSQAELAHQMSRTQTAISYWESGKRTPGIDDLLELAAVLGKDVSFFLPGGREPRQPLRAVMRATAERLDLDELAGDLQSLVDRIEDITPPSRVIQIAAVTPAAAARELLGKAGVASPPVDIEVLANDTGAAVLQRPFDDDLSGLVVEVDGGAVIAVNRNHAHVRQRFTMAHELGHYLLGHHDRFHIDLSSGDQHGTPPGFDWHVERAANDFAAELLMPAAMVVEHGTRGESATELAALFDVSALAMGYRLANLNLR